MWRKSAVGLVLFLVALAISIAFVLYWPRHYFLTRAQMADSTYWTDADLFISVRTTAYARSEIAGAKHFALLNLLVAGNNAFASVPPEFTLYHFDGRKLDRVDLPGAAFTVPLGTSIYFVATKPSADRQVWVWKDGAVVPVLGEEKKVALKSFDDTLADDDDADQPSVPDGWHHAYLFSAHKKNIDVVLHGGTATLTVVPARVGRDLGSLPGEEVTLSSPALPAPVTIVRAASSGTHEISKAEFAAIAARDPNPHKRLGWLRSSQVLAEYVVLLLLPFSPFLVSVLSLLTLKRKLLANLPTDATFPNALPAQFPALDLVRLESLTREAENLGFTRAIDYTVVSGMATQIPAFARLMINPSAGCFAEINQVFPRGKKVELAISFLTRFESWQASTTTRKPNGGNWILRLPHSVWQCKPKMATSELLQVHRKMCDQMAFELGISAKPARGADDFFRDIREGSIKRRNSIQRKWLPVILFEFYAFKFRPKLEWKGDWTKEARNRGGGYATAASAGV